MGDGRTWAKPHEWAFVPLQDGTLPWCESDETDTDRMLDEMEATLSAYLPKGTRPLFQKRSSRPYETRTARAQYIVASDRNFIGMLVRTRG